MLIVLSALFMMSVAWLRQRAMAPRRAAA